MEDRFFKFESEAWVDNKDSFKVCRLLPDGSREVMPDSETAVKVLCRGVRISEEEAMRLASGSEKEKEEEKKQQNLSKEERTKLMLERFQSQFDKAMKNVHKLPQSKY